MPAMTVAPQLSWSYLGHHHQLHLDKGTDSIQTLSMSPPSWQPDLRMFGQTLNFCKQWEEILTLPASTGVGGEEVVCYISAAPPTKPSQCENSRRDSTSTTSSSLRSHFESARRNAAVKIGGLVGRTRWHGPGATRAPSSIQVLRLHHAGKSSKSGS